MSPSGRQETQLIGEPMEGVAIPLEIEDEEEDNEKKSHTETHPSNCECITV